MRIEVTDVVLGELVNLVARAAGGDKVGRYSNQVEVGLEVIGFHDLIFANGSSLDLHTIKWVHNTLISELTLDKFKVLVLAEREMVDCVREIEGVALDHQTHKNV